MRVFIVLLAMCALVVPVCIGAQEQSGEPQDTVKTEPAEAKTEAAEPVSANVARGVFTTGINEREPVDAVETLKTAVDKVFFFTEIVDMEGKTIVHRWVYNGETQAEVSFDIGGPRWRVYSSKTLIPEWIGTWTVEVRDGGGATLSTASFEYSKGE